MNIYYISLFGFLSTLLATYILIKHPIVISKPTSRGLHDVNIPSSGGIAIFVGLLSCHIYGYGSDVYVFLKIFLALLFVVTVGYLDDKYALPKIIRFASQILISTIFVLSYYSHIPFIFIVLMTTFLVYFINIYNFMDGIDSLAVYQGIFFFIGLMFVIPGNEVLLSITSCLLAFLLFNKHPAHIFLGNSGSYLIGFIVGIIIIENFASIDSSIPYIGFLLMTTFLVDSTIAIIRRFITKFNDKKSGILDCIKHITEAHCSHTYQQLTKKYNNHEKVVLMIMSYNIFWCLPMAYLCMKNSDLSILFLLATYAPYSIFCYINKSGIETTQ